LKSVAEICDPRILDQDSSRHAYPTNTGVDFTFSRDATRQRRASTFRLLLDGSNDEVVQGARRREIDNKVSNMSDKPLSISRAVKWRRRGGACANIGRYGRLRRRPVALPSASGLEFSPLCTDCACAPSI